MTLYLHEPEKGIRMLELDNTKRTISISCPRKYQLQNLMHIFSVNGSTALRYGSVWHKTLEGFYNVIAKEGWSGLSKAIMSAGEWGSKAWAEESAKFQFYDDYRTLQNLMQGFVQYLNHYHGDEGLLEVVRTERVFKILITPTLYESSKFPGIKPFYFTGQIDLEVKLSGRKWIKEHKSTGWHVSKLTQTLQRTPQIIGYNYASYVLSEGHEIPDGSLVSIFHTSAYKSKVTGEWGKPKFDFSRVPQIFSMKDLALWRYSLVSDAYRLQHYLKFNTFPERSHSCYTYGACSYINICEQNRPVGKEILNGYFVDPDPWDVLKGKEDRLVVHESEKDLEVWDEMERELLS